MPCSTCKHRQNIKLLFLILISLLLIGHSYKICYSSYQVSYPYGSDTPDGAKARGDGDTIVTFHPLTHYATVDYGNFKQTGFYTETDSEVVIYTGFDSIQAFCKLKNGDIGMQLIGNMMLSFKKV